jgi:hypothetical protein
MTNLENGKVPVSGPSSHLCGVRCRGVQAPTLFVPICIYDLNNGIITTDGDLIETIKSLCVMINKYKLGPYRVA